MIIECISDLHGHYPKLEGGDLLIVAGDLTATDTEDEYDAFDEWLWQQPYKMRIVIAGNHDNALQNPQRIFRDGVLWTDAEYLCDSGTEFEGLKIWGSPWTITFEGMNPHCKAFTVDTEEELEEKWKLIPEDIDILVTHSPPWNILDSTIDELEVGSESLVRLLISKLKPKLHVFGHIHEAFGKVPMWHRTLCVNASHVNERYEPVNKPIRVIL